MIEELINEIWLEYLAETDFEASYNSISYITDCLTRSYYRITKQESHEDSKNRYYRASGRLIHSFILDKLATKLNAKKDVYLKYETPEFVIAGVADIVAGDYVLELKTTTKLPDKPNEAHVEQLNAYMAMANKAYGYIVYLSRANGSAKSFEVTFDPELWQYTQDKAKELRKACLDGYIPKPYKPRSWLIKACKHCEFKEICPHKALSEVSSNGCATLDDF